MTETEWLAERFEANRAHLRSVAFRMLGSATEADDAVQEAWLRLSRTDTSAVENLSGWLTTVVARVCLDMLRRSRRSSPLDAATDHEDSLPGPEDEAVLADSVGLALLVVLETLTPSERIAFVLHDTFDVPFEEIAPIVGRTPVAARQLASRARRRVQGATLEGAADVRRKREVVAAFLAASRDGDFEGLIALLDPDVVLRVDATVAAMGGATEEHGCQPVARTFAGKAKAARAALLDGMPGAVWVMRDVPQVAFRFEVENGLVTEIELVGDRGRLDAMEVVLEV